MSRRRATLSPSLFPFLAVLVCTLGTLILLLALVAEKAQDTSVPQVAEATMASTAAPTTAEPSANAGEDDGPPKLTAAAAARMIEEEQFRVRELVSHRDKQTAEVERRRDQLTQVEAATQKLRDQLKRLSDEVDQAVSPEDAITIDEQAIVMMREEMETLRREIADLEEVKSGAKPRVVIVPHRGPNGTARRPVYVECNQYGVTIQPENTRISHTQLIAGAKATSPMANPLDAALRVVRRHAMQVYGDTTPPYPMLIVRPDGIETFAVARTAMKDWDDQYGYELVPDGVDLAFPDPDRTLKPQIELAVHEASARNIGRYIAGARSGGRGRGGNGGSDGGPDGSSSKPSGQWPANGEFAGANNYAGKLGQDSDAGSGTSPANEFGRKRVGNNKPLPTLSAKALDLQARSNGFLQPRDRDAGLSAGGLASPLPGSNQSRYGAAESRSDALNDYLDRKNDPMSEEAMLDRLAKGQSIDGDSKDDRSPQTSSSNVKGEKIAGGPTPNGGQSASASVSPSSGAPPTQDMPDDAREQTPPSVNMQQQMNAQASPPVRREGRDWALPSSMAGMNGNQVVRPITMACHHDRYELIQDNRVITTYPFAQDGVYNATLRLATDVRDRVETWGATVPGARWQPRLEVLVSPHADQRFHELQTLMNGSGVEIMRRVR